MPPLSEYQDERGGDLAGDFKKTFLEALPELVYKDTREPFKGNPRQIIFSDPIRFYDDQGAELVPLELTPKTPPKDFLRG
jgi:hypothetical protein